MREAAFGLAPVRPSEVLALGHRASERAILVATETPGRPGIVHPALRGEDHQRLTAVCFDDVAHRVTEDLPDLVFLEPRRSDSVILNLLDTIRRCSSVPIIVVSTDGDEQAKVAALDHGADEYVVAPCGERELRSRVRAVLRRASWPAPTPRTNVVVDDRLSIDFGRREVIVDGQRVTLRPTEYRLLYHLVDNAGCVLTHETLLAKVWGFEYRTEEHYVRLYVTYLRQKIEPDPRHPRYIVNARGLGYRFRGPEELQGEPRGPDRKRGDSA